MRQWIVKKCSKNHHKKKSSDRGRLVGWPPSFRRQLRLRLLHQNITILACCPCLRYRKSSLLIAPHRHQAASVLTHHRHLWPKATMRNSFRPIYSTSRSAWRSQYPTNRRKVFGCIYTKKMRHWTRLYYRKFTMHKKWWMLLIWFSLHLFCSNLSKQIPLLDEEESLRRSMILNLWGLVVMDCSMEKMTASLWRA